jgi:hypothetical protein
MLQWQCVHPAAKVAHKKQRTVQKKILGHNQEQAPHHNLI